MQMCCWPKLEPSSASSRPWCINGVQGLAHPGCRAELKAGCVTDAACPQGLSLPQFTHSTMEIAWVVLSVRGRPPRACFCLAAWAEPCLWLSPATSPALSRNIRSQLTLTTQCSLSLFSLQRHPSGFSQARSKPESPWITKRSHSHIFFLRYFPTPSPTSSPQHRQTSWSHCH